MKRPATNHVPVQPRLCRVKRIVTVAEGLKPSIEHRDEVRDESLLVTVHIPRAPARKHIVSCSTLINRGLSNPSLCAVVWLFELSNRGCEVAGLAAR